MLPGWDFFFLISLGGQAPPVLRAHMGHTCGGPKETGLNPHRGGIGPLPAGTASRLKRESFMAEYGGIRAWYLRAVQFHPHGGQFDFVWLSARTPHGAYVW